MGRKGLYILVDRSDRIEARGGQSIGFARDISQCRHVGSAISPHSLLYIMTVDFADRMTTAILRKNYHTVQHLFKIDLETSEIRQIFDRSKILVRSLFINTIDKTTSSSSE